MDPGNGTFTQLGGASWNQAVALTAHGLDLHTVNANRLFRVSPNDGSYDQSGRNLWAVTQGMTTLGNWL